MLAALLLLGASGSVSLTDIWKLDSNTTIVHFTYDNLGLSRQSGRFKDIDGRLEFSPTASEMGMVDITNKAAGGSTWVSELDSLLRSTDFLDTNRHPLIKFRSTQVHPTGEREATSWASCPSWGRPTPSR